MLLRRLTPGVATDVPDLSVKLTHSLSCVLQPETLNPGTHLEARVNISFGFYMWLIVSKTEVLSQRFITAYLIALGAFPPYHGLLGFTATKSLAAFAHLPSAYCLPEDLWSSSERTSTPEALLPYTWLFRHLSSCRGLPASTTWEGIVKCLDQARPEPAGQQQNMCSAVDSGQPYLARLQHMVVLLKVASVLLGFKYQPGKVQSNLGAIWQVVDEFATMSPYIIPRVQAQDGLLSTVVLLVDLIVPLLRQLMKLQEPTSLLARNVCLDVLCNLLDCNPFQTRLAVGKVLLEQLKTACPLHLLRSGHASWKLFARFWAHTKSSTAKRLQQKQALARLLLCLNSSRLDDTDFNDSQLPSLSHDNTCC